ncbi:MAG: NAD(P)/FAD-dependent oxidoreductase [Clostridiales bacterium]|nr:NAD(P)/FAD-dependent oxidoreductase [Clostridiales bacterium]
MVSLDFAPNISEKRLVDHIKQFGNLQGILSPILSRLTAEAAGNDPVLTAKIAKNRLLIITGTKSYKFAQITKGGAELSEFDGFRSLKTNGFYACGEVLDYQFPCGGFNLNFAFYSGITIADEIAKKINS